MPRLQCALLGLCAALLLWGALELRALRSDYQKVYDYLTDYSFEP